jgi:N-acetylneuraminic acid mutarotase
VLDVERFDGQVWQVETRLPGQGLNAAAAVVLNGRIYVIGGFTGVSNMPSDRMLVFEIASRSWSEAERLPAPRGGHAAVVLDGRIHVLGGGNALSTLADHTVYDPATRSWTELAPLPFPRGSPAAVVLDDTIYSIGGRSGGSDFGDVDVYDAAANAWVGLPGIEPVGTAGAVVYRGTIHLFGGEAQARRENVGTVLRFDRTTRTWSAVDALRIPRNYARAATLQEHVYIVGGNVSGPASHNAIGSRVVERYFVRR